MLKVAPRHHVQPHVLHGSKAQHGCNTTMPCALCWLPRGSPGHSCQLPFYIHTLLTGDGRLNPKGRAPVVLTH